LLEALESFAVSARMPIVDDGARPVHARHVGDQPEPWLNSARNSQPLQVKENTISSTDSRSGVVAAGVTSRPTAPVVASMDANDGSPTRTPVPRQ